MKVSRTILRTIGCFTCLLSYACGTEEKVMIVPQHGREASALAVVQDSRWAGGIIPVCWESAAIPSQEDRDLVKNWITENQENQFRANFIGWGVCNGDKYSKGIRIINVDDPNRGPHVTDFGNKNAGEPWNLYLNFFFQKWNDSCSSPPERRKKCITSIAGHEFGHVLGARHEQSRGDTPQECRNWVVSRGYKNEAGSSPQGIVLPSGTPWDLGSMMNYCNDADFAKDYPSYTQDRVLRWNNEGKYSTNDAAGFANFYGYNFESYATGFGPSTTDIYGTERSASNSFKVDVLMTTGSRPTGSGYVEIHSTTYASGYKTFNRHIASSVPVPVNAPHVYGYNFFDWDRDGKADLVYFVSNAASNRLEAHILSGASNYQTYILHVAMNIPASKDYRFAFGDYDGDGVDDIFIFEKYFDRGWLSIMNGANNFQSFLYRDELPLLYEAYDNCKFVLGNFYNHTEKKKLDLVCMSVPPVSGATISMIALKAPNYDYKTVVRDAVITNEDGANAAFFSFYSGLNVDDISGKTNTNFFPGAGMSIGYIKKNSSPAEIHIMDASMYFPTDL